MAENTTQNDLPESVSREAHQRMTDDRNALKAERDQLAATIKDMGYMDKARRHFAEKGLDDPDWAAEVALPSMKSADVEAAAIGEYLDDKFARLYPTTATTDGEQPPPDEGVPTPDAIDPPTFARPSPASDGTPPAKKVYSTSDPEIQAIIASNDTERFRAMVDAGEIELRTTAPVTPG